MRADYEKDVVVWSIEQAALIRAGRFELLDLENIAEEILDVGKSEQRELANRMALLLAHLLKWQFQTELRGSSWQRTIKAQRKGVLSRLDETPSLRGKLSDARWFDMIWSDALAQAANETGLDVSPEVCPWAMDEILAADWFPSFKND